MCLSSENKEALRVGSWPGYGARHNQFIELFLDGLSANGCATISLETIDDFAIRDLDVLVLHWAERVFFAARNRWEILGRIARMIGALRAMSPRTKIVWLVHNLEPHDPTRMQRLIWRPYTRLLAHYTDAVLTLSPGTQEGVRSAVPRFDRLPMGWVWHPAYPDAVLPDLQTQIARQERGWTEGEIVIGYCGQIRAYKGVEELVEAFSQTKNPSLRLLVAGMVQPEGLAGNLRDLSQNDERIHFEFGNLHPGAFREALNCCDIIAAPFRKYLHSGSLIHALSAGRPVLTPSTPFSCALRDKLGADWVRLYEGDVTAEIINRMASDRARAAGPDMADFSATATGANCAAFLRALCD